MIVAPETFSLRGVVSDKFTGNLKKMSEKPFKRIIFEGSGGVVHFFHRPGNKKTQERFLEVVSLPVGALGQVQYVAKYISSAAMRKIGALNDDNKTLDGIYWVLNCQKRENPDGTVSQFDFACPIRRIKVIRRKETSIADEWVIPIIVDKFFTEFIPYSLDALKDVMGIDLDSIETPCPCESDPKLVHVGRRVSISDEILTDDPSLEELFEVIENIPSSDNSSKQKISDYPLVFIQSVGKVVPNKSGIYNLRVKKRYKIYLKGYQSKQNEDRNVHIGLRGGGKIRKSGRNFNVNVKDKFDFVADETGESAINIDVESGDLQYSIDINNYVKMPWPEQYASTIILSGSVICLIVAYFLLIAPTQPREIIFAFLAPLILLILSKADEDRRRLP